MSNQKDLLLPAESNQAPGEPELPELPELPEFSVKNVVGDIIFGVKSLIDNPEANRVIAPVIVCLTSVVAKYVIAHVPYTEIDFVTYMQQIKLINEGEIDYNEIYGDTGPIVYPAGFVQIYQWIGSMTNGGERISTAQTIFSSLLTFTTILALIATTMTPQMKPWPLYLFLASKRLMSIYVLRLFNDCFTTASMVGVVVFLQQGSYWHSTSPYIGYLFSLVAADLFSVAVSIKMNALLYTPAVLIVTYFFSGENLLKFALPIAIIPLVQVMMGWRFLLPLFFDEEAQTIRWNYINQAFNFQRKFLYKWTVNWRFVPEETFLSDIFSNALLAGHVIVLLFFVFTRFLDSRITGKSILQLIKDAFKPSSTVSSKNLLLDFNAGPKIIMLIFSTTNVIGVLFSRSLHYQFLSWYCWQLPFLLYMTGWHFAIGIALWGVHEWSWNVYPSTNESSIALVSVLSVVLLGVWRNENAWFQVYPTHPSQVDEEKKNE
ncbi:Dolichyl-phosphate-mannose-glycolipid alpha-mannosyltransferase [Scheffersomyces xylosifermentans]|uniref:Dolichyl-phosphate-mannose-glycolipid alpha-mannosyltransferase n=1 Tax=Scheffersomyces xylosifermentans TaxID=1304137 RepID=UPI00315D7680